MKNTFALSAMFVLLLNFVSCTNSPSEQAHYSVQSFMKVNIKPGSYYDPVSFSKIDTLSIPDTMTNNKISYFKINHTYSINNNNKEKVTLQADFFLDKELRVNGASVSDLMQGEE